MIEYLPLFTFIFFSLILGIPAYLVASKKGYHSFGTKLLCFIPFINILGYVLYLGLPDLIAHKLADSKLAYVPPPAETLVIKLENEDSKKPCAHCKYLNIQEARFCQECGKPF